MPMVEIAMAVFVLVDDAVGVPVRMRVAVLAMLVLVIGRWPRRFAHPRFFGL